MLETLGKPTLRRAKRAGFLGVSGTPFRRKMLENLVETNVSAREARRILQGFEAPDWDGNVKNPQSGS